MRDTPIRRLRYQALRAIGASLLATVVLPLSVIAVPPTPTFSAPERIGFPGGDDWEPSIAADQLGHVYALWTHYVDYAGGGAGDIDLSCPACPSPHMVIQVSSDGGLTFGSPRALAPSDARQDDPQIVVDADDGSSEHVRRSFRRLRHDLHAGPG